MPHLRELVQLHKDAPFALIGINQGDSPEEFRKGLEQYRVTWISAYQAAESLISIRYGVRGYPTYFLIDADGTLVRTSHSSSDYDAPIAALLKKLGEAPPK